MKMNKKALVKILRDDNLVMTPIFVENQGYSKNKLYRSRISEFFGKNRLLLSEIALQINNLFKSKDRTVLSVVAIIEYTDDDILGITPVAVKQVPDSLLDWMLDDIWGYLELEEAANDS